MERLGLRDTKPEEYEGEREKKARLGNQRQEDPAEARALAGVLRQGKGVGARARASWQQVSGKITGKIKGVSVSTKTFRYFTRLSPIQHEDKTKIE